MRAKTTDGQEFDLKQDLLDGLKMRMRGSLLLPGEPGYEDSRTVWNGMIDRRPAAVARCLGTADVIEGVKLAVANDLLLCIKSGGHNIAGLACADGGLMLDLSPMRGVWVDTRKKIAHAQGGCLLGDVDQGNPASWSGRGTGIRLPDRSSWLDPRRRVWVPHPALGLHCG